MKKKAIKIAASTAVAASAFVAAAPAQQADAAANVNQLTTNAQNAGTVLKWAISVEGSADYVTQPFAQYNAAKASIKAAEAAAAKLSVSEKLAVDAKLVDAKIQVTRAGYYIDAITSSNKIKELTATLDAAIASGDIAKVEAAYHKATAEYRKQAKLLDRVYGQTTRDGIRNAVKPALEASVASVKNEVTVSMLVAAAAADVKAGNIADAHAKIAEAQAILDANVLKWETALQKSVTDAKTALPAIPGNITVETVAFHGEAGNTYAVVANLKDSKGAAYNGPVSLSFTAPSAASTGSYKFVTVNGVDYATAASADTVLPKNGQLVITVTTNDTTNPVAGGKIKFQAKPNGTTVSETTYSGALNFYAVADDSTFPTEDEAKVKYVDVANKYFVTNNLEKYTLKAAGNVYQDVNGAILSLDAFLAKLTAGDTVAGSYKKVGNGSVIQLAIDAVAESEFKVNQYDTAKDNGIKDALNNYVYRVEGNTVTLSGTGEAGKRVSIYNGILNSAVGSTVIGSNGQWSLTLSATGSTTFVAYQSSKVNEAAPLFNNLPAGAILSEKLTVVAGKFVARAAASDLNVVAPATLTGNTVVFTADLDADKDETAVIASNASITLQDGYSLSATYTNGVGGTVIEEHANGFQVTFGVPSKTSIAGKALSGQLSVSSVTGITNAYKFKAEVK
ncbi:hypothetical protein [Psychrobacillus sp.]|uniref:hypothetical protein n=1 Tax=Psychrobacillus sp. TaxID=1871623 RepID=UPI0028BECA60|nr:hypothetical protein [Psychrobacillus sp.]